MGAERGGLDHEPWELDLRRWDARKCEAVDVKSGYLHKTKRTQYPELQYRTATVLSYSTDFTRCFLGDTFRIPGLFYACIGTVLDEVERGHPYYIPGVLLYITFYDRSLRHFLNILLPTVAVICQYCTQRLVVPCKVVTM